MTSSDPAAEVIAALAASGQSLATAESLTGGMIGAALTAVPGASAVYLGGVVAYATPQKTRLAGVPSEVLDAHGPVSAQAAVAMANGVRIETGADWAIAATGVAGPDPQDGHQPGEVWLGLAEPGGVVRATRHHFAGDRAAVRTATTTAALELLFGALERESPHSATRS